MNGLPNPPQRLSAETQRAARSALQLGLSLVGTWSVAIVVRLYLPRQLGPSDFGLYSFTEGLAATAIASLSLGIDSYTLRELPNRPGHASDYFGGTVVLRALLGLLVATGLAAAMLLTGRGPTAARLAVVFALGYLVAGTAQLLAACLQASANVGRLAVVNVVTKLVWGAAILIALSLAVPLELLAAAFVLAESLKLLLLYQEGRDRLGIRFRVDRAATLAVAAASVPYFANSVAISLNRLDIVVLGFMAGAEVVGWYGAAGNFSLLVFLLLPLMGSVVLPLLARVRARSEDDFLAVMGRLTQGIVIVTTPLALMVALGAELWVRLAFGDAFVPAAVTLRVLAPLSLLTYVASLLSMALITLDRRWTVTFTSIVGLVVNPLLCAALIPAGARLLGPGGAGAGAALGVVGMELTIIGLQLRAVGLRVLGPGAPAVMARCLLACVAPVALHALTPGLGDLRLALDAVAYLLAAVALGVLPLRRLRDLAREVLAARPA